jgi:thioredoxin 1
MNLNYTILTDENLDKQMLSTSKLILIDFWGESCIPCKKMAPMLEELTSKYLEDLIFAKVNVNENPLIVSRFDIKGLPAFVFLKNGKILERVYGIQTRSAFKEIIEKNIK